MTYPRTPRPQPASDQVNEIMTWPVAAVEDTDSLATVAQALAANEVGAVSVLRHGALVGMVSERDISACLGTGEDPDRLDAAQVMSPDPVTVAPQAPILEAARIMREARVRHLPVVSDGVITGLVSMRDIFEILLRHAQDPR